ncbi:hypothetical protein AGOR_G00133130 [Albula goreensis]|uniref:Bactericidal permeability-increasing protein n=1 Tax=Albula goreensis TaxID=1534307 RepID=A0A8T3D809_9TELE|nr:hypothetical protein AGOR_G00133130 [Albula goreensis]
MMYLTLLILPCLAAVTLGSNPGIQVALTNKGLQYGTRVGADLLQTKIETVSIPQVSGSVSLGPLGSVQYALSGMKVVKVNLPLPTVGFSEGTGVKADLSGLNIAVSGRWNTHYHIIRDGGTFDLAVFRIGTASVVKLGSDSKGHLSVSSVKCSSSVGDIQISFHGGASFIFKSFVKYFKPEIQSKIQQNICPLFEESIQDVEKYLAGMKVSFQVTPTLLIDMPLVSPPMVQTSNLNLSFKGEFYDVKQHTEPPFVADPFQLPQQDGFMVSLGMSEFTLNSATFAYFSGGKFQINITDKMIPPESPIHLTTTSFGAFVPQLPQMYPNMQMLFHVYATETPMFSFLPDNVTLSLSASAKAYVIEKNSSLVPVFRLDSNASFSGRFLLEGGKLKGSLMLNNVTLTLGASEVGTFQTGTLQYMLRMAMNVAVLPKVNEKLKAGIPLPAIGHVQWVNSMLKVKKGFVAVATDANVS